MILFFIALQIENNINNYTTLNSIKTIERNLRSVSNQNTKDLEQIAIDGYSDDGTRNLISLMKDMTLYFLMKIKRKFIKQ